MNRFAIAALSVLFLAVPAFAQSTWHVDDDNCPGPGDGSVGNPYCSIQDAIDASVNGDTVIVEEGTYLESINFLGKAIAVRSADGAPVTTIDAGGAGSVVTSNSGEGEDTVFDGFTLTGGNASVGGGMQLDGSSATILNCRIINNSATVDGGGLYTNNGSPLLINCTFTFNSAIGSPGRGGGAFAALPNPDFVNCSFYGNTSLSGAGVYFVAFGPGAFVRMTNCIVWGNAGDEISGIGTLYVNQSDVEGSWPGVGNINADPLFVDAPGGDLRLESGSPCIDAGSNPVFMTEAAPLGFAGDGSRLPRFRDDPFTPDTGVGSTLFIDMGPHEYKPLPACPGDTNGDGVVNVTDLLNLLAAWGTCPDF